MCLQSINKTIIKQKNKGIRNSTLDNQLSTNSKVSAVNHQELPVGARDLVTFDGAVVSYPKYVETKLGLLSSFVSG